MQRLLLILFLFFKISFNLTYSSNYIGKNEQFDETLFLTTLPDGQISAHFQFKTFIKTNLSTLPFEENTSKHNDIFPVSLLRLIHLLKIQELHFSLTKGFWRYDRWGLPFRDLPPNAYIWAWFSSYLYSDENWSKLTSLLSGQFCASINLINPTVTTRPKKSFRPSFKRSEENDYYDYVYTASLPQEPICTENLTPFSKMLPCQRQKGLASLLHATKVFRSRFFSMSIDFRFSCLDYKDCNIQGLELRQNVMVVFDPPKILDGKYTWTLNSLFGSSLENYCPLSVSSRVYVETTHLIKLNNNSANLTLTPTRYVGINTDPNKEISIHSLNSPDSLYDHIYAEYDLKAILKSPNSSTVPSWINIGISYCKNCRVRMPKQKRYNQVQVHRHTTGIGIQNGGISVLLTNESPSPVHAIYLDMIPWYLRMYLHTLRIEYCSLDKTMSSIKLEPKFVFYKPAKDRLRPHHLEIELLLPPNSLTKIQFDFEHQFLRWTEFPPDPNHGLYMNPAVVTFIFDHHNPFERLLPYMFEKINRSRITDHKYLNEELKLIDRLCPLRLYTEPLSILMPTPDFSMPYNVICMVSTALSIAFGPIYNLTTRKTKLLDTETKNSDSSGQSRKRFFIF